MKTEVYKGFLVSLQLLCFYGYLREKKTIEKMRYVHKIGEKEHIEILVVVKIFGSQPLQYIDVPQVSAWVFHSFDEFTYFFPSEHM